MRTDAQLDSDFEIIRAALKRAGDEKRTDKPSRNKILVFGNLICDIVDKLNMAPDDTVTLLTGLAYAYAANEDQQEPAAPASPAGEVV